MIKKMKSKVSQILKLIKEKKKACASLIVTWGLIGMNTINAYASSISGNLDNASSGVQQEALSWVEALGALGIVAGAVAGVTGNEKRAKGIIACTAATYVLIKFSPQLWDWFTGIF